MRFCQEDRKLADYIIMQGGHETLIRHGRLITVWWVFTDGCYYQDLEWSEEKEDLIRYGVDPVFSFWEDKNGDIVSLLNAKEGFFCVRKRMKESKRSGI